MVESHLVTPGASLQLLKAYPFGKIWAGEGTVICVLAVFGEGSSPRSVMTMLDDSVISLPLWWVTDNCQQLDGVTTSV